MEVSGHHTPASLPPGKAPGTHWIEGWVGPIVGLENLVNYLIILQSSYTVT